MKISELKREARESLIGKWGKGACIVLAYLAISFLISFVMGLFEEESIMTTLLAVVEIIISVPLSFGLALSFLKLKRNEDVKAFDFIDTAVDNFSKSWRIAGRTILKMILPIIVLVISIVIYAVMIVYSVMQLSLGASEPASGTIIIGVAIYIIAMIYFIFVYLLYSLTSLIAHDNKDMSALDVVKESARLMKGNRGKMVLLELSFVGWMILGAFTLGIGYIWLVPYMQVSIVCFYEKLTQTETTENNVDSPIQEM